MSDVLVTDDALTSRIDHLIEVRVGASDAFFGAEAARIARLSHRMAERFSAGGRLLACASTAAGWSDAHHVAVEFVHPVIVGKRALPAIALGPDELDLIARPGDMTIVFDDAPATIASVGGRGCLTIGFDRGAEWGFDVPGEDPFVRQELIETLYHLLWEHVHVFFEHRGLLEGRDAAPHHDAGASSFLYPFLAEAEIDLDAVLGDVRRSVAMKAIETRALRALTLTDGAETLAAAARALRARFAAGGTLLALGNGGSATDAADATADLRLPPRDWPARRALDLACDPSILTALANDIGPSVLFSRQVIAYGGPEDAVLAFSTSGDSENVIEALAEARRRGLLTIAFVGYGGGRIAGDALADHVVVTRSQHIPRIQEAQAGAWHVLRELVEFA
jgi:D-sedoheptulose 7-phosphate isomerase